MCVCVLSSQSLSLSFYLSLFSVGFFSCSSAVPESMEEGGLCIEGASKRERKPAGALNGREDNETPPPWSLIVEGVRLHLLYRGQLLRGIALKRHGLTCRFHCSGVGIHRKGNRINPRRDYPDLSRNKSWPQKFSKLKIRPTLENYKLTPNIRKLQTVSLIIKNCDLTLNF